MKKYPRSVWIPTAALLAAFLVATAQATNTTYYVDSVGGNDANSGTSMSAPWRTLAKINATTFSAGDKILLKKGDTWSGQLAPLGSGAAGNPITIDAYDAGNAPIVDGGSLVVSDPTSFSQGAAVFLHNQSHWVIQNLEVKNNSGVDNSGSVTPIYDDQGNLTGYTQTPGVLRTGILVQTDPNITRSDIVIQSNYVHDVNGTFVSGPVGSSSVNAYNNGGIIIHDITGYINYGSCNDVEILGNIVVNCCRTGIYGNHERFFPDYFHQKQLDVTKMATNLVIQGNIVQNAGGDGILVSGYNGTLIDSNISQNAGSVSKPNADGNSVAGIWPRTSANTTIQYNEASGTHFLTVDGEGFDVDLGCQNVIFQYNYSHDNEGGFLLIEPGCSNVTVRYNLSVNDGNKQGLFSMPDATAYNLNIYNNTLYIGSAAGAVNIFFTAQDDPNNKNADQKNFNFFNNIVYNLGSGDYSLPTDANGVTYGTFDHNVFYGNHPAHEPADASKLTLDPQLVSPGTAPSGRDNPTGYKLQSTSPALNNGLLAGSNGGLDYWDGVVYSASSPDRGSHNGYATNVGVKSLIDLCEDFSLTYSSTGNMMLDTSVVSSIPTTADEFSGDTYRFKRSSTATGSVVYQSTGATTFSARLYYFSNSDLTKIKFYSSPDGSTWTQVTTSYTTPLATANTWYATVFTPVSNLPAGTNYLKVEFSDTHYAFSPELGQIIITAN